MAYKVFDADSAPVSTDSSRTFAIHGDTVNLPDASFVRDAHLTRDGIDLVLDGPDGTIVVEGYFAAEPAPMLVAPDGTALTPKLVESFTTSEPQFAAANSASDVSPVGAVHEVSGNATVTHKDGTTETIVKGTPIYEGDTVQTDEAGAVNIMFVDQTTFAVSQDAKLAIDKYVFDPSTQAGTTDFSILKGVFVFTSGLIGRDDPDQVKIETPAGSIGIRGTIIAGNVDSGEITVVEGAIVLHDLQGHEITLASQFETARFIPGSAIEHVGHLSAQDVGARFSAVSGVSPGLFSNIQQNEQGGEDSSGGETVAPEAAPEGEAAPAETVPAPDANHSEAVPATAPVIVATASGFGNTSGLAPSVANFSTPAPGTSADLSSPLSAPLPPPPVAPPPAETAAASTAPPPPNTSIDTSHTPPPPPPPTDTPPIFRAEAPAFFYAAAEGQHFTYNFDKEFVNRDPGDVLTYHFDPATATMLNVWNTNGYIFNPTFNNGNGFLDFQVSVLTTDISGPLTIIARDSAGHETAHTFMLNLYDQGNVFTGSLINGVSNQTYVDPSSNNDSEILGGGAATTNNRLFLGNGDDTLTMPNGTAQGNKIWLGDGINTVTIGSTGDINNWIFGGAQQDTFSFTNARNHMFGMDGDDVFNINVANTGLMANLNTPGAANIEIDGGHSNLRAALAVQAAGVNVGGMHAAIGTGIGDALRLSGTGGINFTLIDDNYIKGIERIEGQTGSQVVTLNYDDVMAMTDERHILVINLNAGDVLNFNKMGHNLTDRGYQLVDETPGATPTATTADDTNYHIYSDGVVTLLVNDTGPASFNGLV